MNKFIGFLNHEKRIYITLFLIGVATRLPFLEKFQTHWDGPDYTIALVHYSFVEKTPTEPGYPLYIAFGKLFHLFVPDLHYAILAVSVLFAGVGAVTAYYFGKMVFNSLVGLISSALFLSAPVFYYFGITANPYGLLFTTASLLALAVYLIVIKEKNYGFFLGAVLAFTAGIRPQDVMLLFILFIYGFISLNKREKIFSLISLTVLSFAWFFPTAFAVGGLMVYLKYVFNFFQTGPGINLTIARIIEIAPIIIKGFFLTFTVSTLSLLYFIRPVQRLINRKSKINLRQRKLIILFMVWILPPLLFNIFVRSDHAAHQIAYLSGFLYLIAFSLNKIFEKNKMFLGFVVLLVILFNLFTFFRIRDKNMTKPYISQSYHYSEITKNNIRTPAIVSFVKSLNANQAIVISDPEIFRPLSYYLEDYKVYAYSSLDTDEKSIANTVHFAYKWHYELQQNSSMIVSFPESVKEIILIPNNKTYKFNFPVTQQILAGNAIVYVLNVSHVQKYKFNVHQIEKIN